MKRNMVATAYWRFIGRVVALIKASIDFIEQCYSHIPIFLASFQNLIKSKQNLRVYVHLFHQKNPPSILNSRRGNE